MNQCQRVLRALGVAGEDGITQVDFIRYPTFDGHAPITRLAARIEELRDEGHRIESGERRQRCTVYRLKPQTSLFELPIPKPAGAYDEAA